MFQKRINYILGEHLDNFIMVYFNNIIIYLNSEKEYKEYIKWVLKRLYKENMPIVTDLVMQVCQLLRQDLQELQELVDTMELVESWDEGKQVTWLNSEREYVQELGTSRTNVLNSLIYSTFH